MPTGKASFYSRDPDRLIRDKLDPTKKKYLGIERRRDDRRKAQDRRGDVRFDLTKSDRRQNLGRREDDATLTFW
jgi:hypothetical protein